MKGNAFNDTICLKDSHNVFISWSGERSRRIAETFYFWIQRVIQTVNPFISTNDISKGSFWFSEINAQLNESTLGIIFLTIENMDKPWILFEAGALCKGLSKNSVCTLLIDLKPEDINSPLSGFNHTKLHGRDDFYRLIQKINDSLGEMKISSDVLKDVFNAYYPEFKQKYERILNETKNNIYNENLSDKIDKFKNILSTTSVQLNDIHHFVKDAIVIYAELQKQGIYKVVKCDTNEFEKENNKLDGIIRLSSTVKLMCHIGKTDLNQFISALKYAVKEMECIIQILIISDNLAGKNQPLLRLLCPKYKDDEKTSLDQTKKLIKELINDAAKEAETAKNVSVRTYDFAPTGNILIADNYVRFIPYLSSRQSDDSVALFGNKKEDIFNIFKEFEIVFNEIWENESYELLL